MTDESPDLDLDRLIQQPEPHFAHVGDAMQEAEAGGRCHAEDSAGKVSEAGLRRPQEAVTVLYWMRRSAAAKYLDRGLQKRLRFCLKTFLLNAFQESNVQPVQLPVVSRG